MLQFIGPGRWVNPLEAAFFAQIAPPKGATDPSLDLLEWAVGIGGVALLLVLGSSWAMRLRREAVEAESGDSADPGVLMDAVRDAYFEGEIDTAEYQQLRLKLNPAAAKDVPPLKPSPDPDAAQ